MFWEYTLRVMRPLSFAEITGPSGDGWLRTGVHFGTDIICDYYQQQQY
jgi:hypothetical protein